MNNPNCLQKGLNDGMKGDIVTSLYERINEMHTKLSNSETKQQTIKTKLDDARKLVQEAQPHIEAVNQLLDRINDIAKFQEDSLATNSLDIGASGKPDSVPGAPNGITAEHPIIPPPDFPKKVTSQAVELPEASPRLEIQNGGLSTEVGDSEPPSRVATPSPPVQPKIQDVTGVNTANRYAFNPSTLKLATETPTVPPAAAAPSPIPATQVTAIRREPMSPFGADDKAVADAYLARFICTSPRPIPTERVKGGTKAPSKPDRMRKEAKPAAENLAELMGMSLKPGDSTPAPPRPPAPQKPVAPSAPAQAPPTVSNPAAERAPAPISSTVPNLVAPKVPAKPMNARVFTRLPEDFNHAGSEKEAGGTFYPEEQVCDKAHYNPEKVPIIRLADIPKEVTIQEVLSCIAGGPLYRVNLREGSTRELNDVCITFVHAKHARDFIKHCENKNGVFIKGCKSRIQIAKDSGTKENVVQHATFRKIMTEGVTRAFVIRGLDENFGWNETKVKDLLIAATDQCRIRNPKRFRFEDPLHESDDIYTCQFQGEGKDFEVVVSMRTISWGMMAKWAIHNLQQPEGFYLEQVEGEHGPAISPYDDPNTTPTAKAEWVRDPCDRPLSIMR
ncbi:hypothetical protein ABW19_dt0207851 [Dactylella cylindrospora]|nr:hypothetical protein ABW19_dt0207851 [Dactylella cylindrospora]